MVVKVYISGISGNKEVKKRQQRVILILESKNIKYELLDIAEPNMEEAKEYMQNNSTLMGGTISDPNPRHPLPPQIFNDDEYCGDYDAFDMANETDEMEKFLKLAPDELPEAITDNKIGNGEVPSSDKSKEASPEQDDQENTNEEVKEKSPSPQKEKSPTPEKEKSPTGELDLDAGDNVNATDDEKAEDAKNGSKDHENEDGDEQEETEKSEEA